MSLKSWNIFDDTKQKVPVRKDQKQLSIETPAIWYRTKELSCKSNCNSKTI